MPSLLCFIYQAVLLNHHFSFLGFILYSGSLNIINSIHQASSNDLVGLFLIGFTNFLFGFHTQALAPLFLWNLQYLVVSLLFLKEFYFDLLEADQINACLFRIILAAPSYEFQTVFIFQLALFLFHVAESAFQKVLLLIHNSF